MRDDAFPLAHVAIAVEGASVTSPDIVPLMVANCIIGSFDLTYGGGKVGERILALSVKRKGEKKIPTILFCRFSFSPLSFAHSRMLIP